MRDSFLDDLQTLYSEISKRQDELNNYYKIVKGEENQEAKELCSSFLKRLNLPENSESLVASLNYIVNLREDSLTQFMKQFGLSEDEIEKRLHTAYKFNANFYIKRFSSLIEWIEDKKLLTPFYREIIKGVHRVGVAITKWQPEWRKRIIEGVNKELFELFNGDEDKIFQMLHSKELLDSKDGKIADRCYSILIKEGDDYLVQPYSKAFKYSVIEVTKELDSLVNILEGLEDEVYNQKREWIDYFLAIREAFANENRDTLVSLWADVDRAWMRVTTPLQVGHPLEYYEDKYRKAVALEWDLRVVNPALQSNSTTKEAIKKASLKVANKLEESAKRVFIKNLQQIDSTQLYIGQPMLYYGAELNGLFSAQVVPNDEEVSSELGKKIFAYLDFVRESKRNKPIMQYLLESFGKEFMKKQRDIIINNPKLWNRVYDLSTVGHEFGHILWIDSDTEVVMNQSGMFKNIEEFKATTGGILAFFESEEESLIEPFVDDLVARAVGLMVWREVDEVLPYYTEGLIHLNLLFNSGLIDFDDRLVKIDYSKYKEFKRVYKEAYFKLAKTYIDKEDASEFLFRYVNREDGVYLPKNRRVLEFVESFYSRYKEIGNQVAKETI